ncbi:hypothetical protein Asp14428_79420 [Actinoplanes sp. NBRC 14428]|uniref:Uncharacterized protein n=1 Tax=Pseudosporangium ferrugineum TaxID=439699 RepID=A0A2T0SJJ6_9ACTN|nr:hypothetical protein [Pseudosporangium ferrugineum]PRY33582.1 hypothetical protein CLV70_101745 [Pseudosporangium ferrugineum]BCJ56467.1 hypothetical protein Asp14428_79420 [Actinoplanes sp. NBRC 14428]
MSVGSLSASTISSAYLGAADASAAKKAPEGGEAPTVADHVAAQDEHEPIRSVNATMGTLVDTYL